MLWTIKSALHKLLHTTLITFTEINRMRHLVDYKLAE